jgi:hypothetical protein
MPAGRSKDPTDDYFNDLSRDSQKTERASESPKGGGSSAHSAEGGEGWVPRPKRIACILCRKRKVSSGSLYLYGSVQVDTVDSS